MATRQPDYYARSILSHGDRFWNCQADSFLHNIPLVIMYSGHTRWEAGRSYERRPSDIFAVELVTAGNVDVTIARKRYRVAPGQVFLLPRGKNHRFVTGSAGFLHKRMVIIEGVMLDIILRSLGIDRHDVITLAEPWRLASLIKQANRLLGDQKEENLWRLSLLAYEILLELGRSLAFERVPRAVSLALDYMNVNLGKNLNLDDIARQSGVSMYHFSRVFNKSMACGPMTYFMRQKIAFAKNLLSNTSLLVKEVASLIGFEDPLYFSAQFKKNTGVSPKAYREKNRREWQAPRR